MANDINQVVIIGRLTRDPEVRVSSNNLSIAKFSIANNHTYGKKTEELVYFFNVVTFGKSAEFCKNYLEKGIKIAITGRLTQSRWEDSNNQKRSKVEIIADNIQILTSKRSYDNASNNENDDNNSEFEKKSKKDQKGKDRKYSENSNQMDDDHYNDDDLDDTNDDDDVPF